jgi:hypothetical protein
VVGPVTRPPVQQDYRRTRAGPVIRELEPVNGHDR